MDGVCELNRQGQGYFMKLMDGACELNGQVQGYFMKLVDGVCELNGQGQGYFIKNAWIGFAHFMDRVRFLHEINGSGLRN